MVYQNNIAGNNFLIAVRMNLKPFLVLEIAKSLPSDAVILHLQQFIMKLYCKKNLPDVTNLSDLRWYLFRKCEKDIENLPPTEPSLLLAIHRAHYATYIMKMSNTPIRPSQILVFYTNLKKHKK